MVETLTSRLSHLVGKVARVETESDESTLVKHLAAMHQIEEEEEAVLVQLRTQVSAFNIKRLHQVMDRKIDQMVNRTPKQRRLIIFNSRTVSLPPKIDHYRNILGI